MCGMFVGCVFVFVFVFGGEGGDREREVCWEIGRDR